LKNLNSKLILSSSYVFQFYRKIASKHKKLSLTEERKLIRKARRGDVLARQKLQVHLIGFFIYRIETTLWYPRRREFGEDILQECIIFAADRLPKFKLWFKSKTGEYTSYHLSTYLWKGVTGIIVQQIRQENQRRKKEREWCRE
jgi:hypothetical protein